MAAFVLVGLAWAELAYPAEPMQQPPRTWLVDGFNVLHAAILGGRDRDEWWTEPRRAELLARAARFGGLNEPGGTAGEIWVVFDGPRPATESADPRDDLPARLHSVFAPCADDWLLERVKNAEEPERVAVVTADRRLAARVRHRGAQVVAPADFLRRCAG